MAVKISLRGQLRLSRLDDEDMCFIQYQDISLHIWLSGVDHMPSIVHLILTTSTRAVHFEVISLEACNIGSLQDDVAEI
jgi:hypothetical protein